MLRCLFSWDAPNVNISIFLKQTVYMVYRIEKWNSPSLKKWQFLAKCSCWFNAWTVLLLDSVWNRQVNYQLISSYDYQLISSYAERTWSKRVVLPTLYLQSHLGLQMTGTKKVNCPLNPYRSQVPRLTLLSWSRWLDLGTFDLCQINKDSSKVKNQSDSLILLIRHIAAAQQNQQSGLCAQRILPSAWASAPSDQSLRRPHEDSLGPNSYR